MNPRIIMNTKLLWMHDEGETIGIYVAPGYEVSLVGAKVEGDDKFLKSSEISRSVTKVFWPQWKSGDSYRLIIKLAINAEDHLEEFLTCVIPVTACDDLRSICPDCKQEDTFGDCLCTKI
jgi:hypothetical protein